MYGLSRVSSSGKMRILITFLSLLLLASCTKDTKIGYDYYTDGTIVYIRYYGGYPRASLKKIKLAGANPQTFVALASEKGGGKPTGLLWGKDDSLVFFKNTIIAGADPHTFEVLGIGYARDKGHVYFREQTLKEADPQSFTVIKKDSGEPFAKDDTHQFHGKSTMRMDIDLGSLEVLKRPFYKDTNNVYWGEDFTLLQGAHAQSFHTPDMGPAVNFQYYSFDKNRAYYYENGTILPISPVDSKSFTILSKHYAKDAHRVFYHATVLHDADAESFSVRRRIESHVGYDRNNRFVNGQLKPKTQEK